MKTASAFRNLPLFWKLLLPFLTLLVIVGALGVLVTARDLSSRARATLDRDLARLALDVRSSIRDSELYLVESVNFATNVQGLVAAITRGDRLAVTRLSLSVLALKPDLALLAVTDARGEGIVFFRGRAQRGSGGGDWHRYRPVGTALRTGRKASGVMTVRGTELLSIAGPVCAATCAPVGVVVAGLDFQVLAAKAAREAAAVGSNPRRVGVSIFDLKGRVLARGGDLTAPFVLREEAGLQPARDTMTDRGERLTTMVVPFDLQGTRAGTLGVILPADPAFAAVRGAALRLGAIALAAMIGIVTIGALLSRLILAQVKPLVATNRALEQGDLAARAPVMGRDELGELAAGVNRMAERLQGSQETLEMRVAEQTEEVRRLLDERTEFFAGISHELRTPLAAILAQADLILDRTYRMDGRARRDIGRSVMVSAEQLLKVVNDILDVSRSDMDGIEIHTERVKVPALVRQMRGTLEGLARAGQHKVAFHIPRHLPAVRADPARLRQIILNLVENAVKYTPHGGAIALTAGPRNGSVEISVADTGVGIPAESQHRVFEPFFRAEGTHTQGGQPASGLGLAVTKRLVEAQGGTIRFESVPGSGTVFTLTLQRIPPDTASFRET